MAATNTKENNNTENINTAYEELCNKIAENDKKINELKEDENAQRYFGLIEENDKLQKEKDEVYKKMRKKHFGECNHIWVTTFIDCYAEEGRSHHYSDCLKCGLSEYILYLENMNCSLKYASTDQLAMYEYMKEVSDGFFFPDSYMTGIKTEVACDSDLAKAIYSKIMENHPDLDDDTARKYFEIALDNIRNIRVSEERKESRKKRLALDSNFNSWNVMDIKRY